MKPILLIVFNRPETTKLVVGALRAERPPRIFVAADGPRPGNERDRTRCAETLDTVRNEIDWPCDVSYRILDENLGCKLAVSSAVTWFFDEVEEGIILEDDCVPAPGFLDFCSQMLDRYRNDARVGHIGGYNCQYGRRRGSASYYFSRYFHVWGWASWRRAWNDYDVQMKDFPTFLAEGVLKSLYERASIRTFWMENFSAAAGSELNTWDYQWVYANLKKGRLSIVPNYNLITNIGYGVDATHTGAGKVRVPPVEALPLPLAHPEFVLPCRSADDFTYRHELGMGVFHDFKQLVKRAAGKK
ncbi:MAG: hypothetical protein WCT14_10610 [Treponemataceae bacterium]